MDFLKSLLKRKKKAVAKHRNPDNLRSKRKKIEEKETESFFHQLKQDTDKGSGFTYE